MKYQKQKHEPKFGDVDRVRIISILEGITPEQASKEIAEKGSADIRLGKVLSILEKKRTGETLAKYVKAATGIDQRAIGHAYKARIVFDSLVGSALIPESVYDSALPSWIVPACAIAKELEKTKHASERHNVLTEVAALFMAGKKGDKTTENLNTIKERITGKSAKRLTKAEKALAETQAKLRAAEEELAKMRSEIK